MVGIHATMAWNIIQDKNEHIDGNNGTRISHLNAKIKDQDEQIEVLISEVARLRSENESKPSGSLLESAGISSRANSKHVIKGLQNALEEQREKIASLTRDLDASKDLKNEHAEQALQLERFKEIVRDLRRANADQKRLLDGKQEELDRLNVMKSAVQKEAEERKNSDDIILKLRKRVKDLELLQETATKTAIDGEHEALNGSRTGGRIEASTSFE